MNNKASDVKQHYTKSTIISLILVVIALLPVSTAGVTGSDEMVPIIQNALSALPVTSTRDLATLTAIEAETENAVTTDMTSQVGLSSPQ